MTAGQRNSYEQLEHLHDCYGFEPIFFALQELISRECQRGHVHPLKAASAVRAIRLAKRKLAEGAEAVHSPGRKSKSAALTGFTIRGSK